MRINVVELKRETGRTEQHKFILDQPPVAGTVEVRVTSAGESLVADFTVAAEVTSECDRCLEQFVIPVAAAFTIEYREGEPAREGDDRADISWYDGDWIDVESDAREQIALALPMKALCRDECAGICPVCGENRNHVNCDCEQPDTDPRLEALRELLDR